MVLDDSTLQVLVDSVRVLDDMVLFLENILLVRRGYSRESHIKWQCSVVSLYLKFDEFYQCASIAIQESLIFVSIL